VARRLRLPGPVGVRLDSGDLAALARMARAMLDQAELLGARIFAGGPAPQSCRPPRIGGAVPPRIGGAVPPRSGGAAPIWPGYRRRRGHCGIRSRYQSGLARSLYGPSIKPS
jgi:hypothetical protein